MFKIEDYDLGYVKKLLTSSVTWAPYWSHVKFAWDNRNHPNMCLMFFDKMKRNPKPEYRRLATFLGVNPTDEQLDKVKQMIYNYGKW